jgi:hypothetical protein
VPKDNPSILVGWQALADEVGVGVKRIQQWAKLYRMPYARLGGKVVVPKALLIEWFAGLCTRDQDSLQRDEGEYVESRRRVSGLKSVVAARERERLARERDGTHGSGT